MSECSSEKCMEDFHISLECQQPTPKRKRKLGVGQRYRMCDLRWLAGTYAQGCAHSYDSDHNPPALEGEGHCSHCLFSPCIVSSPTSFVTGQSGPHPRNNQHRFRLYRRLLRELGLWRSPEYLHRKREVTHEADPREIIPLCVVKRQNVKSCEAWLLLLGRYEGGIPATLH